MRKVPYISVFWTFALAIPFTIIALAGVAYIDFHFSEFALAIANFEAATSASGQGWLRELTARFPEILGMAIGMIVIYTIYLFVKRPAHSTRTVRK